MYYLLYLFREIYQIRKPQANTNTTLAARLEPTTVPTGKVSVSSTGGSETSKAQPKVQSRLKRDASKRDHPGEVALN